jgi:hypothetical protein
VASLITIGIQSAKLLLDDEVADLLVFNTNSEDSKFNFVVSNKGTRSAVLYSLKITIPEAMECSHPVVSISTQIKIENKVIEPAKTYALSAITGINKLDLINNFNTSTSSGSGSGVAENLDEFKVCSAELAYLDFDGIDKIKKFNFRCMIEPKCRK